MVCCITALSVAFSFQLINGFSRDMSSEIVTCDFPDCSMDWQSTMQADCPRKGSGVALSSGVPKNDHEMRWSVVLRKSSTVAGARRFGGSTCAKRRTLEASGPSMLLFFQSTQ